MKSTSRIIALTLCLTLHGAIVAAQELVEQQMPFSIGGVGGVYLLVEPGELEIEVFKRDLNVRRRGWDMRVILAGPDREVIDDLVIPHSGGEQGDPPGPLQSVRWSREVDRPGVYALNITTGTDRHGLDIAWGLRTNAEAWVIETSRGHRDERHVEPIALFDADRPADVCFLPRPGEFEIEVEGLSPDVKELALFDDSGTQVATIEVAQEQSTAIRDYLYLPSGDAPEGSARYTVPEDEARGHSPWRLHLPRGQAFLNIDGVTRWAGGDLYPSMAAWTPDLDSWFTVQENRWLISPYHRYVYRDPGAQDAITFRVYNNAPETRTIALSLEFPDAEWPAALSQGSVTLDPHETEEVEGTFTAPDDNGEALVCHVRATPVQDTERFPQYTTYATLAVHAGQAPADQPLDLPLELSPYSHENRQLGYLPDYVVHNQVYFDLENRPYAISSRDLYRRIDGEWIGTEITDAVVRRVPEFDDGTWVTTSTKIAFDADNDLYLLARTGDTSALLHSSDGGDTFTAYVIEGREDEPKQWDIEQFSGHNVPDGPPPVLRFTRTHIDDPDIPTARRDPRVRWRRVYDVELIVAEKTANGDLTLGEPMLVTDACIGTASFHSGATSSLVSRDSQVHIVWGEATDPEASREEIPGVPVYVASYDRDTGELGEPVFMSFGPPPNDTHNIPTITMDSEGHIHVVVGTHGEPFHYLRSLEPNDAYAGWTEAVPTSEETLRQTYIGLVCGADDALHLVFRLAGSGEHLPGSSWTGLAYQRKLPGQDWEDPVMLLVPPFGSYSNYLHRLTIDQEGAPVLSYNYWSTMVFYRNDSRGSRARVEGTMAAVSGRPGTAGRIQRGGWGRAVMTSPDGGDTWRMW